MNGKRKPPTVSMLGALLILFGTLAASGQEKKSVQRTVTETPLGKVDLSKYDEKKPTFWVSPDGRRVAWLTETGIVIDGQAKDYGVRPPNHPPHVKPGSFSFSPDSKRTGYVALLAGQGGRNEFVVLDGKQGAKGYSSIRPGPVFSPDSQHYACICRLAASSFANVTLIDGREGTEQHDNFAWELTFTPDSQRIVYGVKIGENYRMREENLDGSERMERQHGPAKLTGNFFSGPAGQVGYIASEGEKQFVFYDGKDDGQRFKEIQPREIVLSADGKHVAYVAEPSGFDDVAVIDGKPGKVYGGFDGDIIKGSLRLSPDGSRGGYSVKKSREAYVVLDGKEGKPYASVGGPVFSPDSKLAVYQAISGGKRLLVLNGREGQGYDKVGMPQFSPDSKRLVYLAEADGKWRLVDAGKEQKT